MAAAHDPYAALRHRDYRLFLSAGVLASIGSEVQATAIGWELYRRTNSPAALGFAGLAQFLPVLLFALPAGQAADHYSRRVLFQVAQGVAALASLGLAALSLWQGPIVLIFGCLVLAGIARAFTMPARSALLTQVVPLDDLGNAVTWNSSGWQIANVAGPALGGLMIAAAGGQTLAAALPVLGASTVGLLGTPLGLGPLMTASVLSAGGAALADTRGAGVPAYLFAAACSLITIVLLLLIRLRVVAPRPAAARSLASLLAGARFVWRTELLLAAITLDLFAVLLGGATALLPIYALDILGVGAVGLGWLRAAPAAGALVMAFALAHRSPLRRPGAALLIAVAGFGVATIVFGLSRDFWLSFAVLALAGALDNVSVVVRGTLMQKLTPDEMRGRVSAVNSVFISSSNELGAFESGITAQLFGPVVSVVAGGVGTILVVLLVAWHWPRLSGLGPLHQLQPADVESAEAQSLLVEEKREV